MEVHNESDNNRCRYRKKSIHKEIQAGYSQAEVAEILGCSDKTIVSWETGKTAPKMEKAQELSDLYGIPLAYMDFSKAGNSTPLRERESEPQIPAF